MDEVASIVASLKAVYPDAHCALHHRNAFELLVATILSAQCTDVRVNQVTPSLFAKFPDPLALSKASLVQVEKIVHSTGFYRAKAKNLVACAQALVTRHGGEIPKTLEELTGLAGVGRKTANVVLGNAFGIPSGIVVDTHVGRLSRRLGLTKAETPEKVEQDLEMLIPTEDWILFSHLLIEHGRQICEARRPRCLQCFLFDRCPRRGVK